MGFYRVTGPFPVCGYWTGEEFEHEFSDKQEAFLIEVGHITPYVPDEGDEQKEND